MNKTIRLSEKAPVPFCGFDDRRRRVFARE
jgi:hypothetical protein